MKVFTAVVLLFGVFVFLGNPEPSSGEEYFERIGDHEVEDNCLGQLCSQRTCQDLLPSAVVQVYPCPPMCRPGYVCEEGYIRESPSGRCILRSDCHA